MKKKIYYLLSILFAAWFFSSCEKDVAIPESPEPPVPIATDTVIIDNVSYFDSTIDFYSVWFTDANTGYVCGNKGTILKTANGGNSWSKLNIQDTLQFNTIYFIDQNIGFAGGKSSIFKTTDGGNTWLRKENNTWFYDGINDISFINDTIGYACGCCGFDMNSFLPVFLKTTNGGESWVWLDKYGFPTNGFSLYFTNNIGIVVGGSGGVNNNIIKTTDGGANWIDLYPGINLSWTSVFFTSIQTGYVVGTYSQYLGVLLKTTNSGNTWSQTTLDSTHYFEDVYFASNSKGFISGENGILLYSTDGGNSWKKLNTNTTNILSAIHFPISNIGYVVGANGTIIKITITNQ
ncbi:MAG: hypothetical protein HY841_14825 [Bacteroidetes bacterium]|nr:hypothetical protein [Bacteroidota bacterium]